MVIWTPMYLLLVKINLLMILMLNTSTFQMYILMLEDSLVQMMKMVQLIVQVMDMMKVNL